MYGKLVIAGVIAVVGVGYACYQKGLRDGWNAGVLSGERLGRVKQRIDDVAADVRLVHRREFGIVAQTFDN